MGLFHHITVFLISEQEKASFSEAGVVFTDVTRGPRGESVNFDIGEDDPRWGKVFSLLASLEERDGMQKEYRVQNLSMTAPTWKEQMRQMTERVAAATRSRPGPAWLEGYSGQSVEELLSLQNRCCRGDENERLCRWPVRRRILGQRLLEGSAGELSEDTRYCDN